MLLVLPLGVARLPRRGLVLALQRAPPPVVVTKRCRVCRGRYSDEENHAEACRHHPGALRGESARKGDWEATPSDDDLVWTYSCCGGAADAPGCVADRHRSYDDD